jgi:RNA polymerase sigma factor (sigma-70 family)
MSGLEITAAPAPPARPSADAALVAALVEGRSEAVAELYDRYADRLHGFCQGMLRDPHEAADALHDAVLVAVDRIGQLRDPERLRPWLYAICRTQCLARLRRRERTAVAAEPTEVTGARPMVADGGDDVGRAVEGDEAAALLWAAAQGLDEGDRVLLELHLRQGLDGSELAAAAGVRPGQISMVVGRMKERLARSLGALVVARHGRRDCPELDALLRDWDGTLTVLLRKRVARHVDGCDRCEDRRAGLVAPLGSLAVAAPLVAAPAGLRERIVAGAERMAGGEPAPEADAAWDADGFPVDPEAPEVDPGTDEAAGDGTPRGRRRIAVVALAAAGALVAALLAWQVAGGDDGEVRAAERPGPSTTAPGTSPAGAPTSDGGTTTASSTPGSTTPRAGTPTTSRPLGGPASTAPVPGTTPPVDPAPGPGGTGTGGAGSGGTTAPPIRPATISGVDVAPGSIQTSCNPSNDTATVTATVSDPDGPVTLRLRSTPPGGGPATVVPMAAIGGGRYRATLGPFSTVGSASWTVEADGGGAPATRSGSLTVDPCPG